MQRGLHGVNHPALAAALSKVGWAHYHLQNYSKAIEYFREVGRAYCCLEMYNEALEYCLYVLERQQALHPRKDHADVAAALSEVGWACDCLKKYNTALQYYEQAFAMYIRLGINDGQNISITLGRMGLAYHSLEERSRAQKYINLSLRIKKALEDADASQRIRQALAQYKQQRDQAQQESSRKDRGIDLYNVSKNASEDHDPVVDQFLEICQKLFPNNLEDELSREKIDKIEQLCDPARQASAMR